MYILSFYWDAKNGPIQLIHYMKKTKLFIGTDFNATWLLIIYKTKQNKTKHKRDDGKS